MCCFPVANFPSVDLEYLPRIYPFYFLLPVIYYFFVHFFVYTLSTLFALFIPWTPTHIANFFPAIAVSPLQELFSTQVGPLRKVQLNYDSAGKSKGTAHVHFVRPQDAAIAHDKYHNVTLDGKN